MTPELLDRLRDPSLYPDAAGGVEIVQTHLSVVVLAGGSAYKFKKSVKLPFADFSTLERREHFCREELRLNRRLCPEVYLEVIALRGRGPGDASFGGDAPPLEYAVRMRRLDEARLLDRLLEGGEVQAAEIAEVARMVCAFHREADRGPETVRLGAPGPLRDHALANFEETRRFVGAILPGALHSALEARARADFERLLPVLERRAARGCVVDGHGDLHARNICLERPPVIFDCIEFDPSLRCGDLAAEHAFLLMDLRLRGRPALAAAYLGAVLEETGDGELPAVLPALMRYRALVRAKVDAISAGGAAGEGGGGGPLGEEARRYLRLAAALAVEEDGPLWIAFHGLPGTGKTSLASALAAAGGWPVLSSDRVRKELAGVAEGQALPESGYSAEHSRRTYAELLRRAGELSGKGPVVLLDANFRRRAEREALREAARGQGARLALIELSGGEEIVRPRLERRTEAKRDGASADPGAGAADASDADWSVYRTLKGELEPVAPGAADILLRLDAALEPGPLRDVALAALLAPQGEG